MENNEAPNKRESEIDILEAAKNRAFEDWQKMISINADVAHQLINVLEGIDGLKDRFIHVNQTTQYLNQLAVLKELLIASAPNDSKDAMEQRFYPVIYSKVHRASIVDLIMKIVEKMDADFNK